MPKEVEIKVEIHDSRGLVTRLRAAGFRLQTPRTHEMNTLYDVPGLRLRKHGELLRLRKYGSAWILTHKAKDQPGGRHKTRVESETQIEDGAQMARILEALGYIPTFRYEKFRSQWSNGKGQVVVDETPIGKFAEIEGPARWIDQSARRLGIDRSRYITQTYAELFFEWKQKRRSSAGEMTFKAVGRRTPTS
jgi:adenylate cyclase, class 2